MWRPIQKFEKNSCSNIMWKFLGQRSNLSEGRLVCALWSIDAFDAYWTIDMCFILSSSSASSSSVHLPHPCVLRFSCWIYNGWRHMLILRRLRMLRRIQGSWSQLQKKYVYLLSLSYCSLCSDSLLLMRLRQSASQLLRLLLSQVLIKRAPRAKLVLLTTESDWYQLIGGP